MRLINECKNPPSGLLSQVKRSISWIFPGDLEGISSLKLIDVLQPAKETSAHWYKQARKQGHFILAWYNANDRLGASITLNIKDIYQCIPRIYRRTPVATLVITQILAHEVGHHISSVKGHAVGLTGRLEKKPDKEEEMRADRYAVTVINRMRKRLHYRIAAWAVSDLAEWHDARAHLNWKDGKYKEAADQWYKALMLDPDNTRLGHNYWCAKRRCESTE